MSLENNIERIANALEKIADHLTSVPTLTQEVKAPKPPVKPKQHAAPPVTDAAPTPPVAAPAPPVATAPSMTVEELNAALVVEYTRLGNKREPIMEEMAKFGVSSVNDLSVDKYADLLANVKARAA